MRNILFVLFLASFALAGCTSPRSRVDQAPKQTILGADRVELPAIFIKGFVYVDLQINGKGPYRFLIDTGVEGMGVSTRVAEEAGLIFSQKHTFDAHGSGGHTANFPVAPVEQIDCPQFSLRGVNVAVMGSEIADVMVKRGIANFGGVLGMPPIRNVLLEIDYPGQTVSVARLGRGTPALEQGISYQGITPHVTITTPAAKHATVTAAIDTGSEYGLSLNDIASYPTRLGLTKLDGFVVSAGGYYRSLFGQLIGDIKLGSVIWHDSLITDSKVENLVGGNALATWKLVIDQEKKMLWLLGDEKNITMTWQGAIEPDGRPAVYGFATLPEGNDWVVKEVDPGSRAERAGLKVNDRIPLEAFALIPGGRSPEDKVGWIRLQVTRGSEKLEITMEPLPAKAALGAETNTDSVNGK